MQDVRCSGCNKLLFKRHKAHIDLTGINDSIQKRILSQSNLKEAVEIKCDRCKRIIKLESDLFEQQYIEKSQHNQSQNIKLNSVTKSSDGIQEIRCTNCGKKLLEAYGEVKKICPKCKAITHVITTSRGIINLDGVNMG